MEIKELPSAKYLEMLIKQNEKLIEIIERNTTLIELLAAAPQFYEVKEDE